MNLEEIERIKQLKYSYFRAVDQKDWDLFRACFAPDATTSYENGTLSWEGIDAIVEGLMPLIGARTLLTQHQGHHPIIELTGDSSARGSWYLQDFCYETREDWWFHGTAYYADTYTKLAGRWKIQHTGFERVFLLRESPLPPNLKVEFTMHGQAPDPGPAAARKRPEGARSEAEPSEAAGGRGRPRPGPAS